MHNWFSINNFRIKYFILHLNCYNLVSIPYFFCLNKTLCNTVENCVIYTYFTARGGRITIVVSNVDHLFCCECCHILLFPSHNLKLERNVKESMSTTYWVFDLLHRHARHYTSSNFALLLHLITRLVSYMKCVQV